MNNTRFATALHILTLLAKTEGWVSSDWIAGSININPVMVRKEIAVLIKAGMVQSRKGKEGGSMLAKRSSEITLDQVYLAVKNSDVLGKKNAQPNAKCPIGKDINAKLDALITDIDQSVLNDLKLKTLEIFATEFD